MWHELRECEIWQCEELGGAEQYVDFCHRGTLREVFQKAMGNVGRVPGALAGGKDPQRFQGDAHHVQVKARRPLQNAWYGSAESVDG